MDWLRIEAIVLKPSGMLLGLWALGMGLVGLVVGFIVMVEVVRCFERRAVVDGVIGLMVGIALWVGAAACVIVGIWGFVG